MMTNTTPTSNNSLEFVAAPALEPAQVAVDQELMKKYEAELAAVRIAHIHNLLSMTC